MSIQQANSFKPHVVPALTGLGRILFCDHEEASLLDIVVRLAVEAGPSSAAGAWLHVQDPPGRLPATDPLSEVAVGAELDLGEGPCLSAWKEGSTTLVSSAEGPANGSWDNWPRWTAAVGLGRFGSMVAVPLVAGDAVVGAVAVHTPDPLAFDEQDTAGLQEFGKQAGALIGNFQAFTRARRLGEQLTEALGTRDLIGTAKGILMEREAIDEDAAFSLLKSASQRSNRKLREIAHALVRPEKRARRR